MAIDIQYHLRISDSILGGCISFHRVCDNDGTPQKVILNIQHRDTDDEGLWLHMTRDEALEFRTLLGTTLGEPELF